MRRAAGALLGLALLGTGIWLAAARTREPLAEELRPGRRQSGRLRAEDDWARRYELAVPQEAIALRLELRSPHAELELHAEWGALPGTPAEASYGDATDGGLGRVLIDRFSEPPIAGGTLAIQVDWAGRGVPRTSERELAEASFTLEATLHASTLEGVLAPGNSIANALPARGSGARSFRIDVPSGTKLVRLDLSDVTGDLDLYARAGAPVGRLDAGVTFARHLWGRESLLLGDDEALGSGPWYVDVVDAHDEERAVEFRLWCGVSPAPPAELLRLPTLPERLAGPFGGALAGVVELFGQESAGSGTLLSPDGWILTNAHVVTAMGGGRESHVVVACTLDARRAPVELFQAALVEFDEARDLALLRVVSGFLGQPLPPGYRFPALELGKPDELVIGSPLALIGYPSTGGLGSLVTLHCTRGIVSGFDQAGPGTVLKTDAEITGGNSGGAAVDENGRLIGLATSLVEQASGQAGFVHPWTWMPDAWWQRIHPRAPNQGR